MFKIILKQAWQITRQNPILWFFGIFAAPLISLEINFLINGANQVKKVFDYLPKNLFIEKLSWVNKISDLLAVISPQNLIIFSFFILILFILANLTQASLVRTFKYHTKEEKISFKKLLSFGSHYFWAVFLYNLLNFLILAVFFTVFTFFLPSLILRFSQKICLIPFLILTFLVFFILSLIVAFIIKFSIFYFVLEEKRFFEALKVSCLFFLRHWLSIFVLLTLLSLISLILGFLLFLIFLTTSIPFYLIISFFYLLKISGGIILTFVLSLIIYFSLSLLFGGIFSSFQIMTWVCFFQNRNLQKTLN